MFLALQYFRLGCVYWPNCMPQAKPNFSPPPTTTPNYGENSAFGNPPMTSNNITNEHHVLGEYIFFIILC